MWPCLLLKYCACDGVVSCQSTAPAAGLSFWNIGPAALRDLLSSIAAGGVGVLRCPRKNYREKKCRITWRWGHGSVGIALVLPALTDCRWWFESLLVHGSLKCDPPKGNGRGPQKRGEAMAATWYVLYFARETEHIEGRKSACALKLRSHTGHVSSFWTAGLHESNGYLGWWSSPAFFGFRSFSLDVFYMDSSPREPRFAGESQEALDGKKKASRLRMSVVEFCWWLSGSVVVFWVVKRLLGFKSVIWKTGSLPVEAAEELGGVLHV